MSTQPSEPDVMIVNMSGDQELVTRLMQDLHDNGFSVELFQGSLNLTAIPKIFGHAKAGILLASGEGLSQSLLELIYFNVKADQYPNMILISVGESPHGGARTAWQYIDMGKAGYEKAFALLIQHLKTFGTTPATVVDSVSILRIRILEEPLTVSNLTTIISSLTELSTKYWLIAKRRFADLIEYTQTHNGRFAEEANILVTRVSYNSPFNMDWKVDLSAPSVAEALVKTVDGIIQRNARLEQAELENQKKAQEIKHAEQQSAHEQQMVVLEREKQQLEIEQRRLELLEKQLEIQKKGIEYALEIAEKMVDLLHPGADPATRAMEIQVLLPNLVQLQNGKGLELALPVSQENQTAPKQN